MSAPLQFLSVTFLERFIYLFEYSWLHQNESRVLVKLCQLKCHSLWDPG